MERWWQGKLKYSGKKPVPMSLVHQNSTRAGFGSKPGLCSARPATNGVSHGTDRNVMLMKLLTLLVLQNDSIKLFYQKRYRLLENQMCLLNPTASIPVANSPDEGRISSSCGHRTLFHEITEQVIRNTITTDRHSPCTMEVNGELTMPSLTLRNRVPHIFSWTAGWEQSRYGRSEELLSLP